MSGCVEGPTTCLILFYVMCVHVTTFYICMCIYIHTFHYITLHTYIHVYACVLNTGVCVSVWRENCMKDFANISTRTLFYIPIVHIHSTLHSDVYIYTHTYI